MSILNRPPQYDHLYDSEGRLQGGLSALEELAAVIAMGSGDANGDDAGDEDEDEIESAQDFPVSSGVTRRVTPSMDSDEDMSDGEPGSSDDEAMEEIAMEEEGVGPAGRVGPSKAAVEANVGRSPSPSPSPPDPSPSPGASPIAMPTPLRSNGSFTGTISPVRSVMESPRPRSNASRRSSRRNMYDSTTSLARAGFVSVGERLKRKFLEANVLSTLLVGWFLILVCQCRLLCAGSGLIF